MAHFKDKEAPKFLDKPDLVWKDIELNEEQMAHVDDIKYVFNEAKEHKNLF